MADRRVEAFKGKIVLITQTTHQHHFRQSGHQCSPILCLSKAQACPSTDLKGGLCQVTPGLARFRCVCSCSCHQCQGHAAGSIAFLVRRGCLCLGLSGFSTLDYSQCLGIPGCFIFPCQLPDVAIKPSSCDLVSHDARFRLHGPPSRHLHCPADCLYDHLLYPFSWYLDFP